MGPMHAVKLAVIAMLTLTAARAAAQSPSADRLYVASCVSCHGDKGQGSDQAKTLLTDDLMDPALDRRFFDAIRGKADGVPDHDFSDRHTPAQSWSIVNYIRELQYNDRRRRVEPPKPDAQGVYRSQHHAFTLETVIDRGAVETPWSVAFLPDGRMLVTERPGGVRVHSSGKPGGTLSPPVAGTPKVRDDGQGGMLDVAVHPNFRENGWVYLSYSHDIDGRGFTRIVRGRITGPADAPRWSDEQLIFQAKPEHYTHTGIHFGCRIVFAPDDPTTMFFCVGERGDGKRAQDLTRPNGKVFRVKDDGSIPRDNPFVDVPDAYPAIWSYGHRNPQGLAFDPQGRLWSTEHGPRGGDELNQVTRGRNYGWDRVSFGMHYSGQALETPWPDRPATATEPLTEGAIVMPVYRWLPSIAACGLDSVTGAAFPQWRGDLLAGGLIRQTVQRFRIDDGKVVEREEILDGLGRVRDVVTAPDGTIYVALNEPDKIVRLVPSR